MDIVFQIALIAIPSSLVLLTSVFMLKKMAERDVRNLNIELKIQRQKHILPLKLDATQRLILFCERINPNSMVMRLNNPKLPAIAFQQKLLSAIRDEFEHNVAQQMFVSTYVWSVIKTSKEETIKIINMAANQCSKNDLSIDLSNKIFEITAELNKLPTDIAVEDLKKEIQQLF